MTKPYVCSNVIDENVLFPTQVASGTNTLKARLLETKNAVRVTKKDHPHNSGLIVCVEFWGTKCPRSYGLCFAHALHVFANLVPCLLLRTLEKLLFYSFQLVKYSKKWTCSIGLRNV